MFSGHAIGPLLAQAISNDQERKEFIWWLINICLGYAYNNTRFYTEDDEIMLYTFIFAYRPDILTNFPRQYIHGLYYHLYAHYSWLPAHEIYQYEVRKALMVISKYPELLLTPSQAQGFTPLTFEDHSEEAVQDLKAALSLKPTPTSFFPFPQDD